VGLGHKCAYYPHLLLQPGSLPLATGTEQAVDAAASTSTSTATTASAFAATGTTTKFGQTSEMFVRFGY